MGAVQELLGTKRLALLYSRNMTHASNNNEHVLADGQRLDDIIAKGKQAFTNATAAIVDSDDWKNVRFNFSPYILSSTGCKSIHPFYPSMEYNELVCIMETGWTLLIIQFIAVTTERLECVDYQ